SGHRADRGGCRYRGALSAAGATDDGGAEATDGGGARSARGGDRVVGDSRGAPRGEALLLRFDDASGVLDGFQPGVQHPEAGERRGGQQGGTAGGREVPVAAPEHGADAARDREPLGP